MVNTRSLAIRHSTFPHNLIADFAEGYLVLTAKEELSFEDELNKLSDSNEKETVMELMTSWERKGRAEGRAEGRVEGRAEGREEGRQEERISLVKRLLTRRVGALSPTVVRQINRLRGEQLEALAEALLEFTTLDDLRSWLGSSETQPP